MVLVRKKEDGPLDPATEQRSELGDQPTATLSDSDSQVMIHLPVAPFHILSRNHAYKCPSVFRGVHYLFLYTTKDTSKVDAVLAACASLTDLFLYVPLRGNLPTLASMLSLRRLVIQPRTLLAFDPDHPVFRTLTHLELLEISASAEVEDACTKLRLTPKLTHLTLNSIEIYHALSPSLEAFDQLRCVVLLSSEERREMGVDEVPAPLAEDERFVLIGQMQTDSYEDWLRSAHTGETYWAVADAFIAARRAGKGPIIAYAMKIGHGEFNSMR
ncbi:hypothetical protein C8F04DRAFT_1399993 [Mycena alexandri]|uniref:Uncharacterized protein n=1 Tax=Mycena alexandri TaxID=1745969 RepID=A0AAD6SGF0_9AGAR|nr:hypothetical protein C8F04DRAFT_1399993 [Mycena alexandri]